MWDMSLSVEVHVHDTDAARQGGSRVGHSLCADPGTHLYGGKII